MQFKFRPSWKAGIAAALTASTAIVGNPAVGAAAVTPIKVIDYPTFTDGAELLVRGDATVVSPGTSKKVLRLTKNRDHQAGAAWSITKISPTKSFETTFVALISRASMHGDGVAFVLQGGGTGPKAVGWDGGGMGYSGIKPALAVEFDTHKNPYDADGNHLGIITGGNAEIALVSAKSPIPLAGAAFRGTVSYNAVTKSLRVWVNAAAKTGVGVQVLSSTVDLAKIVGTGPVLVGFTGATGSNYGFQDIQSWTLTTGS